MRRGVCSAATLLLALCGCKPLPTGGPAGSANPVATPANSSVVASRADADRNARGSEYGGEREGRRRNRHRGGGHADDNAVAGQFDFYLLTLSWSPAFCETHASSPECGRGLGFVVHGLWPQDVSGSYPEDCSDAPGPANPAADTDIFPTVSLVEHEWQTHGTCSGLGADAFFAAVHTAFHEVKLPPVGGAADARGVTPAALLARFQSANPSFPAGSVALSCGNNELTAVEICMDKNLHAEACQNVRSCRANVVTVTAP